MKKKETIEELIAKNREGLNDNEPPKGHFERFAEKLKKQHRKGVISLNFVLKVAAAVVFVFLAVNQGMLWLSSDNENTGITPGNEKMALASVSPEYEEVEFYYTNAISGGLTQWKRMVREGLIPEEEQQMMEIELHEFEEVYDKLQNDLSTSPNDERVIHAMLEYYQTKLSLINMIVTRLKEVKQKKNRKHENENEI